MAARVTALYRYPVKGCKAHAASESPVEPRGLVGDRRWMIVDEQGAFVSQRGEPRLVAFDPAEHQDGLVLRAPGQPPLFVAAPPPAAPTLSADVWGTRSPVQPVPAADAWLGGWLGYPTRLVYQPDDGIRNVKPAQGTTPADHVSLADSYPLLLASESSLAHVNAHLDAPAEMLRFRPNVVVSGLAPFAELRLTGLRIGSVPFRAVKPCVRCNVVTLDPATGDRGKEPLRTMARLPETRTDEGVVFGMNLVPDGAGVVRVGDPVEVD
jgi:uncharacterized protein YcbX